MTSSALGKLKLKTQDENRYGEVIHSGFLNKKSKGKSWSNRYAVLWEDMGLRFYETELRGNVVGKIKMKYINQIKKLSISQSQELHGNNPYFFSMNSSSLKKTWQFGCVNHEKLTQWVHILQSALTIKNNQVENDNNRYIGHIGHTFSNLEDFSIAHSMSSRASSIQSLSALQIMIKEEHDKGGQGLINMNVMVGINEEEDDAVDLGDDDDDFLEMEVYQNDININIEEKLNEENSNIIFEGNLERKTNQKVLGKHLWESRYFKLSTHSLSIYTNNKTNICESVIKLSSIISVLNVKNDGTDLSENRFDINTKDKIYNFKSENKFICQKWIHYLSQSKKKHRKSIRNNLKQHKQQQSFRRFKRQKTSRDVDRIDTDNDNDDDEENKKEEEEEEEEDKFDEDYKPKLLDVALNDMNNNHCRNLSMRSWVSGIEEITTNTQSFEGFLIRKIGQNDDKIGEKIYFRLSDDTLEFSKIDEIIGKNDINKLHCSNIMGTISVEHIKNVEMIDDNQNNKFIITFNENAYVTQWILQTEKNNKGNAIKWVNILQTAQKEARDIAKTINYNNNDNDNDNEEQQIGKKRKNKKKLGGSLKALQKMINDETIQELEMAGNHEMNSKNLDITKDMIDLQNKNEITNRANNSGCSCLCL